jgi:drug/metabolite transporter (DMT)-like permease
MIGGVGAVLCLLSATFFGAMPIFGKFAYEAGVTPSELLLVRFSLAATVLAALLLVRPSLRHRGREPVAPAPRTGPALSRRRVIAIAVGLGAIGYAAQASLFFSALQRMDASLLSLIFYTYPALVTVASVLLGRDRMTPGRAIALVTASGGAALVLVGAGAAGFHPVGAALAVGAAIVYTTYILVSDTVVHRLPPVVLSTLVMAGATATLGARAVLTGGVAFDFTPAGWFWLVCIAVVSTVGAMLTFFAGLRRTGPSTAAILSTFEPVVTTALASLALGEFLSGVQLAGGVLVLASVVVLQLRPARTSGRAPRVSGARAALETQP